MPLHPKPLVRFALPPPAQLGEYNLRGVEAGMDMVSVSKKSGKVLNTVNRRQNRVGRSPYERRPAREKKEPGS